jgi:hypothetical protein
MPIGIVSDEDFLKESHNSGIVKPNDTNDSKPAEVEDIKRGRPPAKKEVPEELREIIAKSAINGEGSGSAIADAFNVSESSVSAYKVGATSTTNYNQPNESLLSAVTGHKEKISKRATRTLMSALKNITTDKLAAVKARDLAAIAKDMSAIISDMEPKVQVNQNNQQNVQFVFMAPRVKNIEEYPIMTVNE